MKKLIKKSISKKHVEAVKRGRNNRVKGASFERQVASLFKKAYGISLVRTPQSGGFAKKEKKANEFRGDVVAADDSIDLMLHIEAKNTKTWSLPAWFNQAESDCPEGKIPVVVFHKHNTSTNYIALSLEDFFKLVPKENIIKEKI